MTVPRLLLASCILLPAAAASAQVPSPRPSAPTPPHSLRRTAGLHLLDGQLWGGGDDYKVRFDAAGFEFTPALGRAAPRNFPMRFTLLSIDRGAPALQPLRASPPTFQGLRVEYDRGGVIERYDMAPGHMEQSFVFATLPPGTGDLVVRGRLSTELPVTSDGDGLRLEAPGVGGFRIGGVTGIDRDGARITGRVRYQDGILELSLPADWVSRAALPLTLDPLIGAVFPVTVPSSEDDEAPLAAFDDTNDRYLVVWGRVFSASDKDVHGHLVSRFGGLIGTRLFIENSPAFEFEPGVANNNLRNAFVVVYTREGDIFGRCVIAFSGVVSSSAVIAGGVGSFQHFGTLGGDSASRGHVVCAWQSDGDEALQATRVVVSTAFTLSVPGPVHTFARGLSPRAVRPRLSRSGGVPGRHALIFQREFSGGADSDPNAMILDDTGAQITPEASLDTSIADDEAPEIDGDGTNWIAAWSRRVASNDRHVMARSASMERSLLLLTNTATTAMGAISGVDETSPSVMWTGGSCLVGWMAQLAPNTSNWEARVRSVDPFLCSACEGTFPLPRPNALNATPFGASAFSGGGTDRDVLLVWESIDTGNAFNGDIVAQRWSSFDGIVTQFGGRCGDGGTAHATCARSPNPTFTHRLRDAVGNAITLFILSPAAIDVPCPPCRIVPDPTVGILIAVATNAGGEASIGYSIPLASELRGVPLLSQWATLDLVSPACPTFSLEMSNALRVTIE